MEKIKTHYGKIVLIALAWLFVFAYFSNREKQEAVIIPAESDVKISDIVKAQEASGRPLDIRQAERVQRHINHGSIEWIDKQEKLAYSEQKKRASELMKSHHSDYALEETTNNVTNYYLVNEERKRSISLGLDYINGKTYQHVTYQKNHFSYSVYGDIQKGRLEGFGIAYVHKLK